MESVQALPWLFAVAGGALILGVVIAWGQIQAAKRDRQIDPNTPGDDPSKGM